MFVIMQFTLLKHLKHLFPRQLQFHLKNYIQIIQIQSCGPGESRSILGNLFNLKY